MTQTGTTCSTIAEDAYAAAFARTEAWQELTETSEIEDDEERIAAAGVGQHIFFNSLPLPGDGHVFTIGEMLERRVAMLVTMAGEAPLRWTPGEAQGVVYKGGNIIVHVERWIRDSEKSDETIDRNRELQEYLERMFDEAIGYIAETKGDHFSKPVQWEVPPFLNHYKQEEIEGRWQQAAFSIEWGGPPEGN